MVIDNNEPLLKEVMPDFDFSNPSHNPVELANELIQVLRDTGAIGVSANQLGIKARVFVMRSETPVVCFNPRIVDESSEIIELEEGCLSFDKVIVKVKRPKRIKVRYTDVTGEVHTKIFDGMTARVFQHELDHLNGITFRDRVSRYRWEQAKKKASK